MVSVIPALRSACVPTYQTLPPTMEFPSGRWYNHTILKKDNWVNERCTQHIAHRIALESNKTLKNLNHNEYGDRGHIRRRMWKRLDCQNAFKNMFCFINFPRCLPDRDLTLPTCKSACENFFKTCNYEHDLWRCGPSQYFNGYEAEMPTNDSTGNWTYYREFFPGQPFRRNKYTKMGVEDPICTPAVLGSAFSSSSQTMSLGIILLLSSVVGVLTAY
jgi:hypothetical protein